ncbi:MAG: lipopolysaccharide biosynthesis protein [Bryobacterales bacterium]|nr:lipopolysaccharide biosynthesis protein [Bryobacterales bacterium]
MERQDLVRVEQYTVPRAVNLDFAEVGRRWRNRMAAVFIIVMVGSVASAIFIRDYESEMKIVLKKERTDLNVGGQSGADARQAAGEEELNTQADLLRSDDVLRGIVRQLRLDQKTSEPLWIRLFGGRTSAPAEIRTAKAIRQLNSHLEIILPKKSTIMTVRYQSGDPQEAPKVLRALEKSYMEKLMIIRRPPEQSRFFDEEAREYRHKLGEAESRLAAFPGAAGTADGRMELDLTENRLGELRLQFHQTQASIQETEKRIANLEGQFATATPRVTTLVRRADNEYLMMQMRTTLLNLDMKRTELLKKYEPTYREVQQVDRELAQTQAAIESATNNPAHDETTDRDATYEWMKSELAKGRADLNAQQAKAASLTASIAQHENEARRLNRITLQQHDLQREAKSLEEAYQLYGKKREEARVNDALDPSRFLNVAIAQSPTVPVLPRRSPWAYLVGGFVLAAVLSGAVAVVSERLDDSLRNPSDVEAYLGLPVLAVLHVLDLKHADSLQAANWRTR